MEQMEKRPNWMNYPPMLQFYQQVQETGCGLEPDPDLLADPRLGRYREYQLKKFEIPPSIKDFLMQVGLPDQFRPFRLPSEEHEDRYRVYLGTLFWASCLRNETINKKKYLVIGESREFLASSSSTCYKRPDGTEEHIWRHNKEDSVSYEVVELKTGSVWTWYHDSFGDELTFVNSSLEQYLLSMAYWQSFFRDFSKKIESYLKRNKDKHEWEYVDRNRKTLYAPFLNCMKTLDPPALRKRMAFWKRMTDISLI